MNLSEKMASIFQKELQIVIDREQEEAEYLNADYFVDNEDRASAGVKAATEQVIKYGALLCAIHREQAHGEDTTAEQKELESEIKAEYIDAEVSSTWWNN